MTDPTPLTAEEIADLRALHVQHVHRDGCHRHVVDSRLTDSTGPAPYCADCVYDWPCVFARLLVTIADPPALDVERLATYIATSLDTFAHEDSCTLLVEPDSDEAACTCRLEADLAEIFHADKVVRAALATGDEP